MQKWVVVMNKLEEILRIARKKAGLTTVQLGQILGVNNATVSRYERGKLKPGVEVLVKWHSIAPAGSEKQFLREYILKQLKTEHPQHGDLAEGVFESLTSRVELLKKLTAPKGPNPRLRRFEEQCAPQLRRFAELCNQLLSPGTYIDVSVNDVLEMWLHFGMPSEPDPDSILVFRDAAAFIRVQFERMVDRDPAPRESWATTKRRLAKLGVPTIPDGVMREAGKKVSAMVKRAKLGPGTSREEQIERVMGELGAPGFERSTPPNIADKKISKD
ncbi:MAG: helix-turn-helix transcriptional regulator [Candidatus Sulfopaludibacter sp.]|nr:helix-turn-helix transcriptional regulator [Candidatus Sulfopaludibacter sp.]